MRIKKVLIANRGEIAVRIIRACADIDVGTVAVYSEVDRTSPHVLFADEAYFIGPPNPSESYLSIAKIIESALQAGADAVHPGYGFLAENPEFSRKVTEAGLIYIGPEEAAVSALGDKTYAKRLAEDNGIPAIPGREKPVSNEGEAVESADAIGYPVMLKAAAGGGGKGMRTVADKSRMSEHFRTARSEAEASFGDGRLFIEKYIEEPHHVEFQILADNHGKVIHLGERECSVQRRYQKIIEESPSPIMSDELRDEMGAAAIKIAGAARYRGAGTVEFLVDRNLNYYFLEVNTRLQVEHPVTEMRTGSDLVVEQIKIAEGKKLAITQDDIIFNGHAIECRVSSEDPWNDFSPAAGMLDNLIEPGGPGVRVDSGVMSGQEITPFYDPLMAKLIVHGCNRKEAIHRSLRALSEYIIIGIPTTIPFCIEVLRHPDFSEGVYDTRIVSKVLEGGAPSDSQLDESAAALAAAAEYLSSSQNHTTEGTKQGSVSISGWKSTGREESMR